MDNYGAAQQQPNGYQSVPTSWVRGVNESFDALHAENRLLQAQLKALTEHLGVEFKDRPAIPAYVAVVSTKPERSCG